MEGYFFLGICWLLLQDVLWVQARTPGTKSGLTEEVIQGTALVPSETTQALADRCRGYYDVMGQWDPPFNCNASSYLYCCGTCGYRFCCQFKHGRLDQNTCSNYDTPNWANTGNPISQGEDATDDPSKDKTNMIVYIICGVAALMVLVGIFTKLAVEKTQSSTNDLNVSRTLTDLLKQPAHTDFVTDGHRGSVQVQITEVMQRISPRNSIDHANFSSLGMTSSLAHQIGLPLTHNDRAQLVPSISLQEQDFSKYATMKAVENTNEDVCKRFQVVDVFGPSNSYPPGGLNAQCSSSLPESSSYISPKSTNKVKVAKTNTHPLAGAGFQGWDTSHHDIQRHVYANKRQYSIEKLPELFSQQGHYGKKPKCHFSSNRKTEVTV
ncbi:protein shisa-9-like [Spea bombifrons]|uniref:protein shisa-9-like n=1 Tax=Spea bombifrons TaxID=233779 RepID=UPI00234B9D33|nr:protein shisa-9-like [Spea bombifrons]